MSSHEHEDADPGREQLQRWIVGAFRMARASGKPDWYWMSAGVLKNRILEISNNAFREEDFNERTFIAVLRQFPEIVAVDSNHRPPMVELAPDLRRTIEGETLGRESAHLAGRIRRDLWDAVLDYRRPETWVWDPEAQVARAVLFADGSTLAMPTANDDLVLKWRSEFAELHRESFSATSKDGLEAWVASGRATAIPQSLKREWSSFIKSKVISTLAQWANDNSVTLSPFDEGDAPTARESEVLQLRALVIRFVNLMTLEELHQLQIPATVILRTQR